MDLEELELEKLSLDKLDPKDDLELDELELEEDVAVKTRLTRGVSDSASWISKKLLVIRYISS